MEFPPDNGAYMVAAYVVAAAIILIYAISLYFRVRRETRE
jgi:isoprenylcysteine carboxyl methyltransferase (ICMT) family protein YpbQ